MVVKVCDLVSKAALAMGRAKKYQLQAQEGSY
jgi:hypothetical protein